MIDLKTCYKLLDYGYSVITIGDKKIPNHKWKEQQKVKLPKTELERHYNNSTTKGLGLCTGFNGLEVIDVDTKILPTQEEKDLFWNDYLTLLQDNIEDFHNKVAIYRTASGGFHILYKCKKIDGNLKIAKLKGYKEALIESRGIGGYVFTYTDRVSILGYLDVQEISEDDREIIMDCSKHYNYVEDKPEKMPARISSDFEDQTTKTWDDYNDKNNVWDLISTKFSMVGKANGNDLVLRNGSKSAHSGYIFSDTGKLFLYSTGTDYPHEQPLSPFDIYRIDNHNGDYKEACKRLYKDGYGSRMIVQEYKKEEFWTITKKGVIVLDPFKFKRFLESRNIYKYYPIKDLDGYIFIQKDGNFIDTTHEAKIKDLVLKHLYNISEIQVWNMMAKSTPYFSKDFLSMLETANIELSKDTKEHAIIYYKNKAVKITKDSFDLIDYDSLPGYVWKKQVIDRDVILNDESEGVFKSFVWKIAGEDINKYYTLKSVIGYLLHSYKNESKNKAIIFNDELIADTPNGGSGKGLFHAGISKLKKLAMIDGKSFDNTKSFLFQTVDLDSQVLLFDDVKKGFEFEALFSVITEGITIEKKGKDAIKIPFADSPKISITTNYTIKGDGDSFYRRVFEVEMSSYFNKDRSPEDEFGQLLFTDWDDDEWIRFDNFMLRCIQYFLNNGLVKSETINLALRKLINDTNKDFVDFMDGVDFIGQRYYKTDLKEKFINDYEDFSKYKWFTSTMFNKWVNKYCEYKVFELRKGKTNGSRFIEIYGTGTPEQEEEFPF